MGWIKETMKFLLQQRLAGIRPIMALLSLLFYPLSLRTLPPNKPLLPIPPPDKDFLVP